MTALVVGALVAGVALRLALPSVITYLHDEDWTVRHVNAARSGEAWAALGMPSSRGVRNAGMSVWVFIALGLVSFASTPEGLTRAVAVLAIGAHTAALLIPLKLVANEQERRAWIWAIVLTMTNPILVFLERKIWAQSVLPIFDVVMIAAWMRRDTRAGAFVWGFVGALVGQIHMAGFFFAPALALWTRLFGRGKRVSWIAWLAGSVAGALPAIGWVLYLARERPGANAGDPWLRFRLEFYQYFFSDPTGLAGTYVVGDDLFRAMKYPLVSGHPTYLVGAAHVALAIASCAIGLRVLREGWDRRGSIRSLVVGDGSDTSLLLGAVLVAMGLLMTLPSIPIHRHYMLAVFPLPYVFTARAALRRPGGQKWLGVLLGGTTVVSFGLLAFLHANGGAHEFGMSREAQLRTGSSLDDAKTWRPPSESSR
jgi:hypothetical protein